MKLSYVKLGSIPFGPALVKSKRKMPKKGDFIEIRHTHIKSLYDNPWIKVEVNDINDSCVFVSLI
jgi:hypothetical protein